MPSDYGKIRSDNIRRRGEEFDDIGRLISEQLYSDRTHFIYELLQNAEDALDRRFRHNPEDSSCCAVRFKLFRNRLEFRHFGIPFNENDVKGVSDVLKGTKNEDVTQIGKFGIGFKSVYAFTGSPEIHSGDEHFVIKRYIRPEAKEPNRCLSIESDETVFVFPFDNEDLSATKAFDLILDKLRRLGPRVLLFMRRIDEIEWSVEPDGETGQYLKDAKKINSRKTAHFVTVIGQRNDQDENENWLIFERPVMGPNKNDQVIVEIGYRIGTNPKDKKKSIVRIDQSPLVVYFPTEKPTRMGFLIQGPYRTTPARDNIHSDDNWNELLIEETAELVVESLRQLREMGLLSVSVLTALPIKFIEMADDYTFYRYQDGQYYEEFRSIYTKVKKAFLDEDLLPANDGTFVSGGNAKIARGAALMEILNQEQLSALFQPNDEIKWLSGEITEDRTPDLRSYLMQELDINEVDPEVFAGNLSEQFLSSQDDEWLIKFYKFLVEQKALWRPPQSKYDEGGILRTKPILRLQDGVHVSPFRNDGSPNAYLTVGPDTETSLPIVKVELSQKKGPHAFLKELGIPELDIVAEVIEEVLPKYREDPVTVESEENRRDLKKIGRAYSTDSQANKERLRQQLRKTPFILAEYPSSGKTGYRKPDQAYFATDDLRTYFCDDDSIAFVSSEYPDSVTPLLKELGVSDRIRITCKSKPGSIEEVTLGSKWHYRRGLKGFDPDISADGLEIALKNSSTERSEIIWNKIAALYSHCIRGEILISSRKDFSPDASTYYKEEMTSDNFGCLLIDRAWLPDADGDLYKPCDLTLDDLPESFVRDEKLADQLGMKKDVVAKLAEEVGISTEDIELLRQDPEGFRQWKAERELDGKKATFPERNSADPDRRKKQLKDQVKDASKKKYVTRARSVRITEATEYTRTWLKGNYTNAQAQMICQICKEEMPFKKRDGEYYFEAVEALSGKYFTEEHEAQFLALCPECAARYKEFIKRDEAALKDLYGALKGSDGFEVPLKLGELDTSIQFVETHWVDMKTILELSQSDGTVVERSGTWSEQDQKDLTTTSLQYAATLYPEEEDLV